MAMAVRSCAAACRRLRPGVRGPALARPGAPPPAPRWTRRCALEASSGVEVVDEGWLTIRTARLSPRLLDAGKVHEVTTDRLKALPVADASEVAAMAWDAAHHEGSREHWPEVHKQLQGLEFHEFDAVLVLGAMVKMNCFDRRLLLKIVDRIEGRYFSMEMGLDGEERVDARGRPQRAQHPLPMLFEHAGDFRSLIDGLPLDYKVKIALMDDFARETGWKARVQALPEKDAVAEWRTMDPVELEAKERQIFEKGRIKVQRMRHVEAKTKRMRPGNRLRAAVAAELLQALPGAALPELVQMAQLCAFPKVRALHGDVRRDFEEGLADRICDPQFKDPALLQPYLLGLTAAFQHCGGPAAYRAWRTRLLPALNLLAKADTKVLGEQQGFHPRLFGVPRDQETGQDALTTIDRAAYLFVTVTTARQVDLDSGHFNAAARPLKTLLARWLKESTAEGERVAMPLETLADVCGALVSSGIADQKLASLLDAVFVAQFDDDIRSGRLELSAYHSGDLANVAHAVASQGIGASKTLQLIWTVAKPKLRDTEPHLALMLLDAAMRGGAEELLQSPEFFSAVDELLTQKLDYDPAVLGHIAR